MKKQARQVPGIPGQASSFVGRVAEMAAVNDLLGRYRTVTLVGPGGCGKTRLAIQTVRSAAARFDDGTWFVDLASIADARNLEKKVAGVISDRGPRAGGEAPAALADLVGNRHVLLVMDNCEQLAEPIAELTSTLVAACPRLSVLATSREPLRVTGEAVYQVPPLADNDAVRLFVERTRARVPGFLAEGEMRRVVEQICRTLDGLPLAIELASARIGALSAPELLPLLQDRFGLLTGGARDTPARHRTLRAAVDWSYGLLDDAAQELFRRLAVFVGGFDMAAAVVVGGDHAGALIDLVDRSMVTADALPTGGTRYRLLETLREYGIARLEEHNELVPVRGLHLDHFTAVAEQTFREGLASGGNQLLILERDLDNVRVALAWSLENAPAMGVRLVGAARDLWFLRAQDDGLRFAEALLGAAADRDRYRVRALITAGQLANTLQRHDQASAYLEEAIALSREIGDVGQEAWATWVLGVAGFLGREPGNAETALRRSLDLFRAEGDDLGAGRATANLGTVAYLRGDLDRAAELLSSALSVATRADDAWGQGLCHTYLGLASGRAGDRRAAEDHLKRAVLLLAPFGDVTMLTFALAGLALNAPTQARARALRLASGATAARHWIGGDFAPIMVEAIDSLRTVAQVELGAAAAALEWEAGQSMSLEVAVALALGRRATEPRKASTSGLSRREIEIARLVADGLSNAAIASRLTLSTRTVENHVFHVLTKLGLENRTQVAAWVMASAPTTGGQ